MLIVLISLFYFLPKLWRDYPEVLQEFRSGITLQKPPAEIEKPVEEKPEEKLNLEEIKLIEEKKYVEEAKWGEGITHLARRALKEYLEDNPQSFNVTPEHKVYIEDELAKKKGGNWLQLGETLEFSEEMINEAIQKAETLTLQQLQNLTQYSHLVPSLNY